MDTDGGIAAPAKDAISTLTITRVHIAEQSPSQGRDTMLMAIDQLIAEYSTDAKSAV